MASNSTITLQQIVDDAASLGDVAPALATGGYSNAPALSIANDVMRAMLLGGPLGQSFNWKWNRFNVPAFPTISLQQDNFVAGLVTLGWLEDGWAVNINQTSIPKQKIQLEVRRDLEVSYMQTGYTDKICWIPNDMCQTGTWGQAPLGPTAGNPAGSSSSGIGMTGMQNPGPNVIYTNPIGVTASPANPTTCITDPNRNLWLLTTYGTCGTVQPTWPSSPVYPTLAATTTVATTVVDGTCVWTAINPKGQGIRLSSPPPQTGVVWMIQPVGQRRVQVFTKLQQTLDPIPDDYSTYFKQGFFAECYRRNPDPKIRSKYASERQSWLEDLDKAVRQGSREMDDWGFYPGNGVMDTGFSFNGLRPDRPYGPSLG